MAGKGLDPYQPYEGRCNAHRKDGTYCHAYSMPNGRCHRHGGKAAAGIASARFSHGRTSKHMPSRLTERFMEFKKDAELLHLTNEIALVDTRMSELLDSLSEESGTQLWKRLKRHVNYYKRAVRSRHAKDAQEHLDKLFDLIEDGADEYAKWASIMDMIEHRRRVVESERKRMVEMQQMITTQQAMVFLAAVTASVKKHVSDRKALVGIAADLERISNANNIGRA